MTFDIITPPNIFTDIPFGAEFTIMVSSDECKNVHFLWIKGKYTMTDLTIMTPDKRRVGVRVYAWIRWRQDHEDRSPTTMWGDKTIPTPKMEIDPGHFGWEAATKIPQPFSSRWAPDEPGDWTIFAYDRIRANWWEFGESGVLNIKVAKIPVTLLPTLTGKPFLRLGETARYEVKASAFRFFKPEPEIPDIRGDHVSVEVKEVTPGAPPIAPLYMYDLTTGTIRIDITAPTGITIPSLYEIRVSTKETPMYQRSPKPPLTHIPILFTVVPVKSPTFLTFTVDKFPATYKEGESVKITGRLTLAVGTEIAGRWVPPGTGIPGQTVKWYVGKTEYTDTTGADGSFTRTFTAPSPKAPPLPDIILIEGEFAGTKDYYGSKGLGFFTVYKEIKGAVIPTLETEPPVVGSGTPFVVRGSTLPPTAGMTVQIHDMATKRVLATATTLSGGTFVFPELTVVGDGPKSLIIKIFGLGFPEVSYPFVVTIYKPPTWVSATAPIFAGGGETVEIAARVTTIKIKEVREEPVAGERVRLKIGPDIYPLVTDPAGWVRMRKKMPEFTMAEALRRVVKFVEVQAFYDGSPKFKASYSIPRYITIFARMPAIIK